MTGTELMTGEITDSNSARIGHELLSIGCNVQQKVTLPDQLDMLADTILNASKLADVLIINGGLGPTSDDYTAEALAMAMNVKLSEHPAAIKHLQQWCHKRNYPLDSQNRKQAILPEGTEVIPNPPGSAVGFRTTLNNCLIVATPGVPAELDEMITAEVLPLLKSQFGLSSHNLAIYRVFGMTEAKIQKRMNAFIAKHPHIEIGFRAAMPYIDIKAVARNADEHAKVEHYIHTQFGQHILPVSGSSLAVLLIQQLAKRQQKIVVAESCTGGMIASLITQVAGASSVFETGYVTYSNHSKHKHLGVAMELFEQHGAVSREVVYAMAEGALKNTGADAVISVSGIAGPGGGTAEKPVGLVWIAWGVSEKKGHPQTEIHTKALYLPGSRYVFQILISHIALDLIRRALIAQETGDYQEPDYLHSRAFRTAF